jgi:outer membrane protease
MMGGFNGSVRLMDKLTINGGWWLALSEGSGGEMDDYDWLDTGSSDWTHYSLSEVDVTEGYIIDLNVAWDLVQDWNSVNASVLAGYKQDGWSWEDHGVYLLYPEYGYVPQDLNGENLINYEQEFRMPYLGASADWSLGNFKVMGHLIWSPLVSATDWDEHVARTLQFKESFEGGDMFGAGLEARYSFTQGFMNGTFVSAAVDYQKIDLIIGDMTVTDYSTGETGGDSDVAGIENEYMVISLGLGVDF